MTRGNSWDLDCMGATGGGFEPPVLFRTAGIARRHWRAKAPASGTRRPPLSSGFNALNRALC